MNKPIRLRIATGIAASLAALMLLSGCSSTQPTTANKTQTAQPSSAAKTEQSAAPSEKPTDKPTQAAKPEASETSLLPAAEGKTTYPLVLESPYGKTTLKKRPERIAAIVPNAIDTELLLALGVKPVLSSAMLTEGGYLQAYGADKVDTYTYTMGEDLPIEAIAASKPDLIVTVGWVPGYGELRDYYDKLAQISAVVTSPEATERVVRWQDSLRILGKTLDLSDAADAILAKHEEQFKKIREEHPEFNGLTATWAIYYGPKNGLHYFSQPKSAPAAFLTDLGFKDNPNAQEFVKGTKVSDELLSKIDADVLILGQSGAVKEGEMEQFTDQPLFKNLKAVTSGRYVHLPPKTDDGGDLLWAITSGGPIGNAWAAERMVPKIDAVLASQ